MFPSLSETCQNRLSFSTRYASAQVLLATEFLSAEYIEGLGMLPLLLSGSIV